VLADGTVYLWTYDGTTQMLYRNGIVQTNANIATVKVGQISRLNGEVDAEVDTFELLNESTTTEGTLVDANGIVVVDANGNYVIPTQGQ